MSSSVVNASGFVLNTPGHFAFLERGVTEGMSTAIQLQQAPPGVTKTGVTPPGASSKIALVSGES